MKDIKDYLHIYLQSGVYCQTPDGIGKLGMLGILGRFGFGMNPGYKEFDASEVKPLLRPLSAIDWREVVEYFELPESAELVKTDFNKKRAEFQYRYISNNPKLNLEDGYSYSAVGLPCDGRNIETSPDKISYLLQKGFDLFGLIEEGLAIDSTTKTKTAST